MVPRRAFLALPLIAVIVSLLYLAALGLSLLLGLPSHLSLPWAIRLLGVPLLVLGLGMIAWVMRFRGFRAVLDSSYTTFLKLLRQIPLEVPATRTEPLVVAGPYRLVRHPLYSGVLGLSLGIGLLVDRPWAILGAVALWGWFTLVLAPFEERELVALFGEDYVEYMDTHRRFLPIPRRRRTPR